MPSGKWSRKEKARLITLHEQGMSADQISIDLKRRREAVISQLHQMAYVTRDSPEQTKPAKPRHRRSEFFYFGPVQDITITGGTKPDSKGISLLTATKAQCRWPLEWKAPDGSPRCCGDTREGRWSYCTFHNDRAFLSRIIPSPDGSAEEV